MPYIIEVVQAGRTVEVMKYYSSRYGKKGIKRGERKALTKEEQIKVNKRAAEKKLRRLINENFQEGDTHLVLDYRKERRPAERVQMREDADDFLREMRKLYKRHGIPFKYIHVMEIGKKGALHHHLVINTPEEISQQAIVRCWKGRGRTHHNPLDDTGQDRIEEYSSDKEQCYLNTENVTRFSYKGNDYTILADTVSNGGLGEWIGYIRQLAAIDENGKILLQENVEPATFQSLADLAEKAPEAAYIIPFLNVYAAPNADDYLIVDVNGGYHKAVISENVKDSDTVFDFKKTEESINDSFEVNPENATQLLWGGTVYQVTSDMVSDDELGSYIDILAESVTFDTETKIPLSKEDLSKIDWYGENAGQGRESWFYTDVYEIYGTDKAEAVAVNVNDNYYIAKRQ